MFSVDTSKKPQAAKKPVPIIISKNRIELKSDPKNMVEVKPKVINSNVNQAVSATKTDQEIFTDTMFEIY